MSSSGLHSFLQGTTPHSGTVRKLTAWYFRMVAKRGDGPSTEVAHAALQVLLQPFGPGQQEEVSRDVVRLLLQRCRQAEVPPPAWLLELVRALEE